MRGGDGAQVGERVVVAPVVVEDLPPGELVGEVARLVAHEGRDGGLGHVVVRAERDHHAHVLRARPQGVADQVGQHRDGRVAGAVGHHEGDALAVEVVAADGIGDEAPDLVLGQRRLRAADGRPEVEA